MHRYKLIFHMTSDERLMFTMEDKSVPMNRHEYAEHIVELPYFSFPHGDGLVVINMSNVASFIIKEITEEV